MIYGGRMSHKVEPRGAKVILNGIAEYNETDNEQIEIDRIYQGDCLALLPGIPDLSMDMVLTDPPYSSGGLVSSSRARPTGEKYIVTGTKMVRPDFLGDNRDQRSFLIWCTLWMAQCYRVLKDGGLILCFTDWRQLSTITGRYPSRRIHLAGRLRLGQDRGGQVGQGKVQAPVRVCGLRLERRFSQEL